MKLRNKKTGEIVTIGKRLEDDFDFVGLVLKVDHSNDTIEMDDRIEYHSLAELNEEWEDYEPAEPLIKDEKIRKVVRAWAKINTFEPGYSVMYDAGIFGLTSCQADIEFNFPLKELKGGKYYTIEELCGEEEE